MDRKGRRLLQPVQREAEGLSASRSPGSDRIRTGTLSLLFDAFSSREPVPAPLYECGASTGHEPPVSRGEHGKNPLEYSRVNRAYGAFPGSLGGTGQPRGD